MNKFILVQTGAEVQIGDVLVCHGKYKNEFGNYFLKQEITVTKDNIQDLIDCGIIRIENKEDSKKIPSELYYYIKRIGTKLNYSYQDILKHLQVTYKISKSAVLSMILKEIALVIDENYTDHIKCSPEIYVISTISGKIVKIDKAYIKNYNNFAAFRSFKDAEIAYTIVEPILKLMF